MATRDEISSSSGGSQKSSPTAQPKASQPYPPMYFVAQTRDTLEIYQGLITSSVSGDSASKLDVQSTTVTTQVDNTMLIALPSVSTSAPQRDPTEVMACVSLLVPTSSPSLSPAVTPPISRFTMPTACASGTSSTAAPPDATSPTSSNSAVTSPMLAAVKADRSSSQLQVLSLSSKGRELLRIAESKVTDVQFSPKMTYLVTWRRDLMDRRRGTDGQLVNSGETNLSVYEVATGKLLAAFLQKRWPALHWTEDERWCIRLMSASAYVVPGNNLLQNPPVTALEDRILDLRVSKSSPAVVAVLCVSKSENAMGHSAGEGWVRIYDITDFKKEILAHQFSAIDSADLLWNNVSSTGKSSCSGSTLLVHSKTDVDATGRSYYGTSSLFLFSMSQKQVWHVRMGQGERVHDVAWAPSGKEFIAVYGEMPGNKATLFAEHGEVIFQFPTAPQNTVSWSPDGRMILIAGFGNLNGEMTIWSREKLSSKGSQGKISHMTHGSVTSVSWSPDSRYLLTCVCCPRMRVDNRLVIWKHDGTVVFQKEYSELFMASWCSLPPCRAFPVRDLSPPRIGQPMVSIGAKVTQQAKSAVYRSAYSSSSVSDAIKNYKATSTTGYVGRTVAVSGGASNATSGAKPAGNVSGPAFGGDRWGSLRGCSAGTSSSESTSKSVNAAPPAAANYVPGMTPEMLEKQRLAREKKSKESGSGGGGGKKGKNKEKEKAKEDEMMTSSNGPSGENSKKSNRRKDQKDNEQSASSSASASALPSDSCPIATPSTSSSSSSTSSSSGSGPTSGPGQDPTAAKGLSPTGNSRAGEASEKKAGRSRRGGKGGHKGEKE